MKGKLLNTYFRLFFKLSVLEQLKKEGLFS
mgnify:CR=1 FL=1